MKIFYSHWLNKIIERGVFGLMLLLVFISFSCMQQKRVKNPPGYNLSAPVKYTLSSILTEISGLAFYKGDPEMVYAQEDESGRVYQFDMNDPHLMHTKFAGKGDYEDIAIAREQVIMLRSDGALFIFPFSELNKHDEPIVKTYENLLPKGEYEGMYADEKTGKVFVICKSCKGSKKDKGTNGFIFNLMTGGVLQPAGSFNVTLPDAEKKKSRFAPSALTKNPRTGEWYILSSVNKILVVTDTNWKVKETYPLSVSVFPQPEGIAFDKNYNLYISNEGGLGNGNILKFVYKQ